jgi:hypothetical protein
LAQVVQLLQRVAVLVPIPISTLTADLVRQMDLMLEQLRPITFIPIHKVVVLVVIQQQARKSLYFHFLILAVVSAV